MQIHQLESNTLGKMRSSCVISSITQCVSELVLNSLDAKSTAIAIRINFVTFRIQVVDNGDGISGHNLNLIGPRHMTNKLKNFQDLQSQRTYYGYRGEALASIINMSKIVDITSKHRGSKETVKKTFLESVGSNVISVTDRPSYGTTVTIREFLYNLPLRRNRIVPEIELAHITRNIEYVILIHPNVSFTLRNDVTGDLLLNSKKCGDIISSFKSLHPTINSESCLIKAAKDNISIKGLLFKEMHESNYMQYIYVNKRPVKSSKIQLFISGLFQKYRKVNECLSQQFFYNKKEGYPIYLVSIKCPYSLVDIYSSPTKITVEFQNWDIVFKCIEKLFTSFFCGNNKQGTKEKQLSNCKPLKTDCGISQINGVVKSYGFKRRCILNDQSLLPKKVPKIDNNYAEINCFGLDNSQYPANDNCGKETRLQKQNHKSLKNKTKQNVGLLIDSREVDSLTKNIGKFKSFKNGDDNSNETFKFLLEKESSDKVFQKTPFITNVDINVQSEEKTSCLSRFTNDEYKGKDLIMDMFLKSTQVYNSKEDDEDSNKSKSTVLEVESNYLLNNITKINGINKTMSVSINIRKKFKKQKRKMNRRRETVSKSVQTSLDNNMITKCVQTSTYLGHNRDDLNCSNGSFNSEVAKNCTLILSTHRSPYFRLKHVNNLESFQFEVPRPRNNTKLFDFNKLKHCTAKNNLCNISLKNIHFENNVQLNKTENMWISEKNNCNGDHDNTYLSHVIALLRKRFCGVNKLCQKKTVNTSPDIFSVPKSFNPQFQSTQLNQIHDGKYVHMPDENADVFKMQNTFFTANFDIFNSRDQLLPFEDGSNFQTTANIICTSQLKRVCKDDNKTHCKTENKINQIRSNLLQKSVETCCQDMGNNILSFPQNDNIKENSLDDYTKLFITLSNQQKQKILEKEFNAEKEFYKKIYLESESQMSISRDKKNDQNLLDECKQEWVKRHNNFGSTFYINKKTGFTTFYTPKVMCNDFKFCKRFEFIPKGLSPILKEVGEIDKSLSQNKKDKLENYIMETYRHELNDVKWQKYITNNDPKKFFEELYKDRVNSVESCIPSIFKKHMGSTPISFDKELFNTITVIGQVDKKFIAVLECTKKFVILFDQHAVHERIRLEELLNGYKTARMPLHGNKLMIFLTPTDISLLRKYEKYLNSLGLYVKFYKDGINVMEVPSYLYDKFSSKKTSITLNMIIELLVKDVIMLVREGQGISLESPPKLIQNIINMEACRGAIKFGDKLTINDCERLLKKLSICNLPFQCAHGRPSLVPLLTLNFNNQFASKKVNFGNLHSTLCMYVKI